jgi:hypothetical protein
VEVLFKNKDNFYPDVATLAYIKNLKESYHANINAEIEKIQPIGDRTEDKIASNKLRLKFLKDEHDAFQNEKYCDVKTKRPKNVSAKLLTPRSITWEKG